MAKQHSSLRRTVAAVLFDVTVANAGLFLGLLARYVTLIGLNQAPKILLDYSSPANLWNDSLQAYWSAMPWLTVSYLLVFALSGFYRSGSSYPERKLASIVQSGTIAYLMFAATSYAMVLAEYLTGRGGFAPGCASISIVCLVEK